MPIYEYRCLSCRRKVSLLVRQTSSQLRCPHCGSDSLSRLMSSFAVVRSEESRLDALADPGAWGDVDEGDPRSLACMARKLKSEAGEEMGPGFDEMVDKLESGEALDEEGAEGESEGSDQYID